MSDDEFLNYVCTRASIPRPNFTPAELARLSRLAGHSEEATAWDNDTQPSVVCRKHLILSLVELALDRADKSEQDDDATN